MTRGQRSTVLPAKFPPSTWNLYERVKGDLPRSNNAVEGFHSAFSKGMAPHPELYKLAELYRKMQHSKALAREQSREKVPAGRKQYVEATRRFKSLLDKFDRGVLVDLPYLDKIVKVAKVKI